MKYEKRVAGFNQTVQHTVVIRWEWESLHEHYRIIAL
jgi:hypothetical protein